MAIQENRQFDKKMSSFNYIYKKQSWQQIVEYKKELIVLLNRVVEMLDKHNVKYMLDCGTLLGFVRDKKMIRDDGDCDLFIFGETLNMDFIDELMNAGLMRNDPKSQFANYKMLYDSFVKGKYIEPVGLKVEDTTKPFFRPNNPFYPSIDLFVFVPYGQERYARFIRQSYVRHNRQVTDEVVDYTMQYGTYKIPKQYDAMLKCYYGDGWVTPDPKFHDETRDITKYGWYGMCDRESVGQIKVCYKTMDVIETTGIAMKNQQLIGISDENGKPTDIDFIRYFKNPTPKDLEHMFEPVNLYTRRFFANWAICRLSGMKRSNHVVANWELFNESEKKRYKAFIKTLL